MHLNMPSLAPLFSSSSADRAEPPPSGTTYNESISVVSLWWASSCSCAFLGDAGHKRECIHVSVTSPRAARLPHGRPQQPDLRPAPTGPAAQVSLASAPLPKRKQKRDCSQIRANTHTANTKDELLCSPGPTSLWISGPELQRACCSSLLPEEGALIWLYTYPKAGSGCLWPNRRRSSTGRSTMTESGTRSVDSRMKTCSVFKTAALESRVLHPSSCVWWPCCLQVIFSLEKKKFRLVVDGIRAQDGQLTNAELTSMQHFMSPVYLGGAPEPFYKELKVHS